MSRANCPLNDNFPDEKLLLMKNLMTFGEVGGQKSHFVALMLKLHCLISFGKSHFIGTKMISPL